MDIDTINANNLTRMSITTSTIAYDSDLRISYLDLSHYVKADQDEILAVKSTCIPLNECINGGYLTRATRILKRRERIKKKLGEVYGRPSRTLSGNQLYFQSSVEFVRRYNDIYHNIRISPARGSIQIQGVRRNIFITAETEIMNTLNYIKKYMPHITQTFKLFNRRIIIANTKCAISPALMQKYTNIRIDKTAYLLYKLSILQRDNKELPLEIPYHIIFVTNEFEVGSYIRIKFITPIPENHNRKTTVKIFSGCKINLLGAPTLECPIRIYKFLDEFITLYEKEIFFNKVLSNSRDINTYISNTNKNEYAWIRLVENNLT